MIKIVTTIFITSSKVSYIMQDVAATKERILSIIQQKGPSLPVQIARAINVSPLFTAVFLSELREDNKLKTSDMKIGSSPLYYLKGQEAQLENFIEYLNHREKEAFFLIKNSQILEDDKQTPVMRVALRAIKDFALPFKAQSDSIEKIFWRYNLLEEEEFTKKMQKTLNPLAKTEEAPIKKPEEEKEEIKIETKEKELPILLSEPTETVPKEPQTKTRVKKSTVPSEFAEKIKEFLTAKDIEVLATLLEKKKEFIAKIRTDTLFGKQEYYLIAKDKKKINETDLTLALQKAQSEKMIALILSPGEIDKKALPHAKEWRNLIKFEKISL